MKTWEEFKKYQRYSADELDFYGCVDGDGMWFDSSRSFDVAVHFCCYYANEFNLTPAEELRWMDEEGRKRGYSIIHGTLIKQMYEKGLIK
jgi:hypothetical protein